MGSSIGVTQLWSTLRRSYAAERDTGSQYWHKVNAIRRGNLIAQWPIWEPDGTDVHDYSGMRRHAVSVDLGARAAGSDGVHQAALFDGATSYVNVYSAALAAAFNGAEGTIVIWPKVYNVGVWTDGLIHFATAFFADVNNNVQLYKDTIDRLVWIYIAGGVAVAVALIVNPTAFMCLGLTWSKSNNRMRAFYNGLQTGVDQVGLGVWAGALDATWTVIGAYNTVPLYSWYGWIAHGALWNVELSPSEVKQASEV
jgi:hypothetical protein